jgi:hypothetical protein
MKRGRLIKKLDFKDYVDGDSVSYKIDCDLDDEKEVYNILDEVCRLENLNPLKGEWNKLSYPDLSDLLLNGLRYDLAFTSSERMSLDDAQHFHDKILSGIDKGKCICFTNWFENPWKSGGSSWNSISDYTFDMAIVFMNQNKVTFTYVVGED